MAIEIWQQHRPKGRRPVWAFRIRTGDVVSFESRTQSIRLGTEAAAAWLAGTVEASLCENADGAAFRLDWQGDLSDDCLAANNGMRAHAEWMSGPRRGGRWYCSVTTDDGKSVFHTSDRPDIRLCSGSAARWLCEILIVHGNRG